MLFFMYSSHLSRWCLRQQSMHLSCVSGWWWLVSVANEPCFLLLLLLFLWLSDFFWAPAYAVVASLEKIGSLTNTALSSKNSTKAFNDGYLCWLICSISAFLFHLSVTRFSNFETKIHGVSGVSIVFHFVAAPRLLHLFKKANKSRYNFASPYFFGGQFFISFL